MRKTMILLILISLLAISVTPAFAGELPACDITITGATAQTDYVAVQWNASAGCSGDFGVYIEAFNYDSFYSGELDIDFVPDIYSYDVIPADYGYEWTYRIIYDGPYSGTTGANSFSLPISPELTSEFDYMYYSVSGDGYVNSDEYEIPVSGSGASGSVCGTDGRVNSADCARDTWALYVTAEGNGFNIQVWDTLLGQSVIFVFDDDIADLPANPSENTIIATSADGRMILSKLTTGEYQLNVVEPDGKVSVLVFTLPLSESYRLDYEASN